MEEAQNQSVQVAINIRPLLERELAQGSSNPFQIDGNAISVRKSEKRFAFDHVFDQQERKTLFDLAVKPIIEGCLDGFNSTILAYGQTGSGKTFTMGTSGESSSGILSYVVNDVFERIKDRNSQNIKIKVSFLEIYREDLFDLLGQGDETSLQIREDANRNVMVAGLSEMEVQTPNDVFKYLHKGCERRVTAATNMNSTSSRSHAIFSLHIENTETEDGSVRTAHIHLVDLAGSERAKKTKAEGTRLLEGIDINKGLLVLGNVISILGGARSSSHVPYRDSKLTRILQDSLGGNSRTLMIACISPADINFEETINTLKYANRARNIQNAVVENRSNENQAQLIAELRSTIQNLQKQLQSGHRSGAVATSNLNDVATRKLILQLSTRNFQLEEELSRRAEQSQPSNLEQTMTDCMAEPIVNHLADDDDELCIEDDSQLELQLALRGQLDEMNSTLHLKSVAIKQMTESHASFETMRLASENVIKGLEVELDMLQQERDDLVKRLHDGTSEQQAKRQSLLAKKLEEVSEKNKSLVRKQAELEKLLKMQQKQSTSLKAVQDEVLVLKKNKVDIMKKMKQEAEDHRRWRNEKQKEIKQMEKKERLNEYMFVTLQRKHENQARVLQQRTDEANAVRQKLKQVLASRGPSSNTSKTVIVNRENCAGFIEKQVEVRTSILRARRTLDDSIAQRKLIVNNPVELQDCSDRIAELQEYIFEAQGMVRPLPCHSSQQAKILVDAMMQKLVTASVSNLDLELRASNQKEEYDDALRNFNKREYELQVEMSQILRDCEEKVNLCIAGVNSTGLDQVVEGQVQTLSQENERLLHLLASQGPPQPGKKALKTKKRAETVVESDFEDFSDEEDWDSEEDDQSDEDWMEPNHKKKKKTRVSHESATSFKSVDSNVEIPAVTVERVNAFKVKDLQDALSYFGISVSGRKDVLKQRLLTHLSSDANIILPDPIPSRHKRQSEESGCLSHNQNEDPVKEPATMNNSDNSSPNRETVRLPSDESQNSSQKVTVAPKQSDESISATVPPVKTKLDTKDREPLAGTKRPTLQISSTTVNKVSVQDRHATVVNRPMGVQQATKLVSVAADKSKSSNEAQQPMKKPRLDMGNGSSVKDQENDMQQRLKMWREQKQGKSSQNVHSRGPLMPVNHSR